MSQSRLAEGVQTKELGTSDEDLAATIKETAELNKAREVAQNSSKNSSHVEPNQEGSESSNLEVLPDNPNLQSGQTNNSSTGTTGVTAASTGTVGGDGNFTQPPVLPKLDALEVSLPPPPPTTAPPPENSQLNKTTNNQGQETDTLPIKQKVKVVNEATGEAVVVKEDDKGHRVVEVKPDDRVITDKPPVAKDPQTSSNDQKPKVDNVFTAKNLDPEPVRTENKFGSDNFNKAPVEKPNQDTKPYSTEPTGNKSSSPEPIKTDSYKPETPKPIDSPPRSAEQPYKEQPSSATNTTKPTVQTNDSQPAQFKSNEQPAPIVTNEPPSKATTQTSEARSDKSPVTTPQAAPQRASEQKSEPITRAASDTKPTVEVQKPEVPQPKIITKPDLPKAAESVKTDNVVLAAKIKDLVQQVVSTNSKDIVRVQAKEELIKIVESAVKKATFEGKNADLVQVIKQIIAEPVIKDTIRVVTSSSGDNHSIKELKALLDQVVAIRNKGEVAQKLELNTATPKRIEDIQGPVISKEAALAALVGILVDADKITSRLVKEVQLETTSKISQIQSTVDELIKLRVEQFISLSVKGYGVDGATFKALCQETIAELANRYGLNDQQRALLNQILIQISESDFSGGRPATSTDKDKDKVKQPDQKDPNELNKRELTPKEIEALFQKEVETLEAFLKEREEIKRAKAEAELVNLLAEVIDETMSYKIDEDLEVIKVFTIKGIVVDQKTKAPIPNVKIYAGILGIYETDQDGNFIIRNVPQLTRYIIGADHSEYVFTPPYHSGTLDTSVEITFEATSSRL